MNTSQVERSPGRHRISARNDSVILDAGARLAAEEGWAGLTPGHVAQATGLSRPTVLHRHPNRAALGCAVWRERLAEPLRQSLGRLVAAVDRPGLSSQILTDALAPFLRPAPDVRAAIELLQVSTYVPDLAEAVDLSVGASFREWFGSPAVPHIAARRAFVVALAFGYAFDAGRRHDGPLDLSVDIAWWARALCDLSAAQRLPLVYADELDVPMRIETGDPVWDAVLTATLECVAEVGYEAATIEVIAARSGFTRTVIFRRYATKYDLFMDACHRMLGPFLLRLDSLRTRLETSYGTAISDAVSIREMGRPERRALRVILLEQVRMASHHQALGNVIGEAIVQPERPMAHTVSTPEVAFEQSMVASETAIGSGLHLLTQVMPSIWDLPFDTVFVPWRQAMR